MYSGLIPLIKQAALDAVNNSQPVNILFGTVKSISPLKVQVSPKLVLGAGNLVLAGSLTKQDIKVNSSTTVTIDNSLKSGDEVILARIQGGNKYLVLDKAVSA